MTTGQYPIALNAIDTKNQPPLYFLLVQDSLILTCGVLWTITYVLYVLQAYRDHSYGMPIMSLCANIAWELVYGVIYPLSLAETCTFVPWFLVDIGMAWTVIKFGPQEWKNSPLVARSLSMIMVVGSIVMLFLHLSVIHSMDSVDEAAFWSGFVLQSVLGCSSVAQLLSRNSTRGHSWSIWVCRWLGSLATIGMFRWRYAHYPDDYASAATPLATFMFVMTEVADFTYAFVYSYISKQRDIKRA